MNEDNFYDEKAAMIVIEWRYFLVSNDFKSKIKS